MITEKQNIPVIKTFVAGGCYYLYDTYTNRLINIQKEHYIELGWLQKIGIAEYKALNLCDKAYKDIIVLMNKGFLKPPQIKKIQHAETKYVKYLVDRCINDLTLQVTRDCNFSCRYCLFAVNNQVERAHEKKHMTWDIAKRAIDYMYLHSQDMQEVQLSFYGGEPLMNFPIIKKAVQYAEKVFKLKSVNYNMTINGSLLNESIVRFLAKNRFHLTISLDGTREIQNSHRKFLATGNDTFDVVYSNILFVKNNYPDYFKNYITFNPVLFKDENIDNAYCVFKELGISVEKVFFKYANLSGIDYINSGVFSKPSDSETITFYREKETQPLASALENKSTIPCIWHHGGPCIPGVKCLFVDINGVFYPCEKIIENGALSIGNLDTGINIEKVTKFINIGKLTENDCNKCWAIRFCDICISSCVDVDSNEISAVRKAAACEQQRKKALDYIKQQVN